MNQTVIPEGGFVTTREAADLLSYSRPDSLMRAWRAAGLPVYRRRSGRNLVAVADFAKFIEPEDMPTAERPVR